MKKLVLFDLDGTLLNTIEDIRFVLNTILEKYGYKTLDTKTTLGYVGRGAKHLVTMATGCTDEVALAPILADYVKMQEECDNELTVLYDGLDKLLLDLKKDGYKIAIVSNKPDPVTQIVVKQKLEKYNFDFVTGHRAELFPPKPDRGCVDFCLNGLNINKEDAIYVGDSDIDVKTFLTAGIEGVGVTWGFRTKEELIAAGCTTFADTADELYRIIKNS